MTAENPNLSIEERIHEARELLSALHAVGRANSEEFEIEDAAVLAGVARIARQAYAVLGPILDAPGDVLNMRP